MSEPNLLLLHGALGASSQFAPLIPLLEDDFELHTLDFEGHGGRDLAFGSSESLPTPGGLFSMERFVRNVLDYLERQSITQTHIFGYSMGGYVACLLALRHPQIVSRIVTLGTKYIWTLEVAEREIGYLDVNKILDKVPRFAQTLAERHTALGWKTVVLHTAEMLKVLGRTGGLTPMIMANLQTPVRIMVGDRDNSVSIEESADLYRALPHGELEVLPGTRHELERVPVERLADSILSFQA
jgi:pimeloyl-ACP methyl ester carboxylesterase